MNQITRYPRRHVPATAGCHCLASSRTRGQPPAPFARRLASAALAATFGLAASGAHAIAIGGNDSGGLDVIAIGPNSGGGHGDRDVAIGASAGQAQSGNDNVAIGTSAGLRQDGVETVSIGRLAGVDSYGSDTLAFGNRAGQGGAGNDRVSVGADSFTDDAGSVALGARSHATGGGIAIGMGSVALTGDVVSFGTGYGQYATRRLIYVSPGIVSETSTDAVNGAQLFSLTTLVTQNTADLVTLRDLVDAQSQGAGTPSGGGSAPDLAPIVAEHTGQIDSLDRQMADVLHYDSVAHDRLSLGGGTGQTVKLGNVAPGELSETSTDAVNGSQLFATNQNVALLNQRVAGMGGEIAALGDGLTRLGKRIDDVDARASTGTAMAIASAQILPNPHADGNLAVGVGLGTYSGRAALAFGGTAVLNPTTLVKATLALSNGGRAAFGAGANLTF